MNFKTHPHDSDVSRDESGKPGSLVLRNGDTIRLIGGVERCGEEDGAEGVVA